jgi:hypothetical protein
MKKKREGAPLFFPLALWPNPYMGNNIISQ